MCHICQVYRERERKKMDVYPAGLKPNALAGINASFQILNMAERDLDCTEGP